MAISIPLSSKLAVTAEQGYFLRQSSQPNYHFDWHMHDCAMLLWPQFGALDSRWLAEPGTDPQALQLVRHTALLLPVSAAHSTRSPAQRQRHGELYLRPELLGRHSRFGVFRLDAAAVAMLDALAAATLAPDGAEPLVHALMAQLAARRPWQWLHPGRMDRSESVSQRMLKCYARALDLETTMPSVEAVAAELGVSVRQLQRSCATELGNSPVAIRRLLLAAKARELIAQGMVPATISSHLGFTHSGHLNRLLRGVPA
ncbi:AraC-type DNA-binding protein [Variovorax sp. YR750]|uniref:helix-turn-helix transcriptional regulator n=1 Tax=Variovorax sp. YR750 TaxID=1884384 RepID=UPI0008B7D13C|nr:helix-turn-helix domain-containing protein [Variovorax sp. YR750]SEL04519.1 AraC-type DNA-binding protein [Variovorax sp. YR750]